MARLSSQLGARRRELWEAQGRVKLERALRTQLEARPPPGPTLDPALTLTQP